MNVQPLGVTEETAALMLKEYRAHRDVYDKRDWEIERIYRAIAKGKTVISVQNAIRGAGVDAQNRPKLAICRADAIRAECYHYLAELIFGIAGTRTRRGQRIKGGVPIQWPELRTNWWSLVALVPRIPPQHRPKQDTLHNYHILWEADWSEIPRDPYLLRRIGTDAWVVLAAWELTDVELSVLRARPSS